MENLYVLIAILVIGLATFALRSSFLVLAGRISFPPRLVRALRFVPAAILSAIVFPALVVGPSGALHIGFDNPKLLAGLVAALIAWGTRNMLATILLGMAALWIIKAFLPM